LHCGSRNIDNCYCDTDEVISDGTVQSGTEKYWEGYVWGDEPDQWNVCLPVLVGLV